jgi:SET domain-containing protein
MGNTVFRPASISWYLNESKIPNVGCDKDFKFYATADIKADDELTVNYDEYSER